MVHVSSRITIIAGHYGSGKTEFAVNFAYSEVSLENKALNGKKRFTL